MCTNHPATHTHTHAHALTHSLTFGRIIWNSSQPIIDANCSTCSAKNTYPNICVAVVFRKVTKQLDTIQFTALTRLISLWSHFLHTNPPPPLSFCLFVFCLFFLIHGANFRRCCLARGKTPHESFFPEPLSVYSADQPDAATAPTPPAAMDNSVEIKSMT